MKHQIVRFYTQDDDDSNGEQKLWLECRCGWTTCGDHADDLIKIHIAHREELEPE